MEKGDENGGFKNGPSCWQIGLEYYYKLNIGISFMKDVQANVI